MIVSLNVSNISFGAFRTMTGTAQNIGQACLALDSLSKAAQVPLRIQATIVTTGDDIKLFKQYERRIGGLKGRSLSWYVSQRDRLFPVKQTLAAPEVMNACVTPQAIDLRTLRIQPIKKSA
jgi:hypothetical protein